MTSTAPNDGNPGKGLDPELAARLLAVRSRDGAAQGLRERIKRERRFLVPALALALLAWPNFGMAKVDGRSMEPTYHTGDTLYLLKSYRYFSPVKIGDVVVIRMKHTEISGEAIVKRIVFVQNAAGDAPWPREIRTTHGFLPSRMLFSSYVTKQEVVPPRGIMVMGDNMQNSMDSRDFGPVLGSEIDGKVINR